MSGKFGTSMFIGVYFCLKYIYKWGEIFSEKKVYSNITDFDASKKKKEINMKWNEKKADNKNLLRIHPPRLIVYFFQ